MMKKEEGKKRASASAGDCLPSNNFLCFYFFEQSFKTTVWLGKKPPKKAELALCLQPPVSFLMLCCTLHALVEWGQTEGRSCMSKWTDGGVFTNFERVLVPFVTSRGARFAELRDWAHFLEHWGTESEGKGDLWSFLGSSHTNCHFVQLRWFWQTLSSTLNYSDNQQRSESTVWLLKKRRRNACNPH